MSWWFRPISFHSKSYADNGVAGHVSNCKLMFSSETEDQNTKTFTKTMNFPVNNLALVSLCTKNLTFKTWNWFLIRKQMEDHGLRRHPRLIMIEQVFVVH